MPVTPQVPINDNRIIQIHGEHSSRCPAIQQPSIWRITSIRIPNWCKMRSPLIGTVTIFLKLMGHIIAAIHPFQKPPKPLILKFRKISHRILRRCHCRTLIGADMCRYLLLESITGFHRPSRSGRRLFIGCNSHICSIGPGQTPTSHGHTSTRHHPHLRCAIPNVPATMVSTRSRMRRLLLH